ncbi:unnamed protein product [Vitrella brassicaformis CCMP3155]|uniref:START domain-containing protein n=2 Tax=Vitrella brassicaformis TaxID=1169539 RepID=A0A0G4EUW6_VITBC|nr:unnamed protein product [Vitrella brassicaformis CCMP3155]|eukprot:CEM02126.1 unnamed protein product [Vitrella brassicaformis CCMP3155]
MRVALLLPLPAVLLPWMDTAAASTLLPPTNTSQPPPCADDGLEGLLPPDLCRDGHQPPGNLTLPHLLPVNASLINAELARGEEPLSGDLWDLMDRQANASLLRQTKTSGRGVPVRKEPDDGDEVLGMAFGLLGGDSDEGHEDDDDADSDEEPAEDSTDTAAEPEPPPKHQEAIEPEEEPEPEPPDEEGPPPPAPIPEPSISDESLQECLDRARSVRDGGIAFEKEGWEKVHEARICTLWRRRVGSSGENGGVKLYEYMAVGSFDDISVVDYNITTGDLDFRRSWDDNIDTVRVVQSLTCDTADEEEEVDVDVDLDVEETIYWRFKLPWPLQDRDFVYARRFRRYHCQDGDDALVSVSQAVTREDCPEIGGVVRIRTFKSHLVLFTRHKSGSIDQPGMDYVMYHFDDPRVNLPSWVTSYLTAQALPTTMQTLHDTARALRTKRLAERGAPPEEEAEVEVPTPTPTPAPAPPPPPVPPVRPPEEFFPITPPKLVKRRPAPVTEERDEGVTHKGKLASALQVLRKKVKEKKAREQEEQRAHERVTGPVRFHDRRPVTAVDIVLQEDGQEGLPQQDISRPTHAHPREEQPQHQHRRTPSLRVGEPVKARRIALDEVDLVEHAGMDTDLVIVSMGRLVGRRERWRRVLSGARGRLVVTSADPLNDSSVMDMTKRRRRPVTWVQRREGVVGTALPSSRRSAVVDGRRRKSEKRRGKGKKGKRPSGTKDGSNDSSGGGGGGGGGGGSEAAASDV